MEEIYINITGPALAFLLYENIKSPHEQEGFLLGDTSEIVRKTITDSDSNSVRLQKTININSVIPSPRTCLFYTETGKIIDEKLRDILGPQQKNVVAWFRYVPKSKLVLPARGKIIHRELSKISPIPPELFSCCLLSSFKSKLESTLTFKHTFLRFKHGGFVPVPLLVVNLGESSNCYKPEIRSSKLFLELCRSLKVQQTGVSSLQVIEDIQDKLQVETAQIVQKLAKSEARKGQLEREVEELRQQILLKKKIIAEKAQQTSQEETVDKYVSEVTLKIDSNIMMHFDDDDDDEENTSKRDENPEEKFVEKDSEKSEDSLSSLTAAKNKTKKTVPKKKTDIKVKGSEKGQKVEVNKVQVPEECEDEIFTDIVREESIMTDVMVNNLSGEIADKEEEFTRNRGTYKLRSAAECKNNT